MRDLSPTLFRGQPDGGLRTTANFIRPLFFAEDFDLAQSYGRGTRPVACVLQGSRVLDLTVPDYMDPQHRELVERLTAKFDEWVCRISGEPRDVWSFLEAGDLYSYSGCGNEERWNTLFQVALDEMGFHAVRVLDVTDGLRVNYEPLNIWVTQRADLVRRATPGEELAQRLAQCAWGEPDTRRAGNPLPQCSWEQIEAWMEEHPSLHDVSGRIARMLRAGQPLTREVSSFLNGEIGDLVSRAEPLSIVRGDGDGLIRPGDLVRVARKWEQSPQELTLVHPEDLLLTELSDTRFVYCPSAWRAGLHEDMDTADVLRRLAPEMVRMLVDGEAHRLERHTKQLAAVRKQMLAQFPDELAESYHGPAHWQRVCAHAAAVARSLGVDPLVPAIFGLVHDSQRLDDGPDPQHGPRAAEFVHEHREGLFSFLRDDEIEDLAIACEQHSNGVTEGSAIQMACWDGDRLDLGRVNVRPDPSYLCTEYARRPDVIAAALRMSGSTCLDDEDFDQDEDGDQDSNELAFHSRRSSHRQSDRLRY